MKTEFLKFLDEHGAHELFENNLTKSPFSDETYCDISEVTSTDDHRQWINSFVWDGDEWNFWHILDQEWRAICDASRPVYSSPLEPSNGVKIPHKLEISGCGSQKKRHAASYKTPTGVPISGMGSTRRGGAL